MSERTTRQWGALCLGVSVIAASVLISGCAMYNHPYPAPTASELSATAQRPDQTPKFELRVVQSDDYGSFWGKGDAQATIDRVTHLSKSRNTLVVLFVHGWHHNADPADENLKDSIVSMNALADQLNTPDRKALRKEQTGQEDVSLVGIYIGWRGRSLPSYLDYLTFWGRKNAAERVGEGDVSEFIERLQRIYLRANAIDRTSEDPGIKRPITGLITVGHSFGGQVLWKALSRQLESPLTQRSNCVADRLNPTAPSELSSERVAINSLGDLNILLNPALEAYQFARVDALYRQIKFLPEQTPQLVVFSADNDDARKIWFPLGRAATGPFRPNFRTDNDGYQGRLWGRALGEVREQTTHLLDRTSAPDSLTQQDYLNPVKILAYDFTQETVFANIRLTPTNGSDGQAPRVPNSPVMVVRTEDKIVDGHNGIFRPEFREFLARYVAFIEGKRLLIRQQSLRENVQPAATKIVTTDGRTLRGDPDTTDGGCVP